MTHSYLVAREKMVILHLRAVPKVSTVNTHKQDVNQDKLNSFDGGTKARKRKVISPYKSYYKAGGRMFETCIKRRFQETSGNIKNRRIKPIAYQLLRIIPVATGDYSTAA